MIWPDWERLKAAGPGAASASVAVVGVAWLIVATGWVSVTHLAHVAETVGVKGHMKWLLAGVPDALAGVGGAYMLRSSTDRFGKVLAWVAVGLGLTVSLGGNVAAVLDAVDTNDGWMVFRAVVVAGLAPMALAIVILLVEVHHHRRPVAVEAAPVPSVAVVSPLPAPEVPATPPLEDERSLTLAPVLEVVADRTPDVVPVVAAAVEPSVGPTVAAGKAERQAQVRDLHLVGWSKAEMATHLGVSPKTIGRDLDDLDLTDPTTPGAPSSNGHHTPEPVGV